MLSTLLSKLWDTMKDNESAHLILLAIFAILTSGLIFVYTTLSAQSVMVEKRIEQKIERIESYSVPRAELLQLEKRLEAIHADIREIRNTQQK